MIAPMKPLGVTLDRQLAEDTPVVTLAFWFGDRQPTETRRGSGMCADVALYRWPAQANERI